MLSHAQKLSYDTGRFPFARLLETSVYRVAPLGQLHHFWSRQKARRGLPPGLGYEDNMRLRKLMQTLPDDAPFMKLYHHFVRNVIAPRFGSRVSYSTRPKMRVHLAGTSSVSKWHRDVDITGRLDQINAFLPFTSCHGGATLWCESGYGLGDFRPLPLEYGEVLLFDGGLLEHGTVENDTQSTRVSLDFRFAPTRPGLEPPWSEIIGHRPGAAAAFRPDRAPSARGR